VKRTWRETHEAGGRLDAVIAVATGMASSLLLAVLHPRIGVRDADAVAYVVGAMSMRAGRGYVDLMGGPLNHWPPGYSWLLSFSSEPIFASQAVNYAAYGLCTGLLFRLARAAGWPRFSALCVTVAIVVGFLRGVATNTAPDILTYAAFVWAATAWVRSAGARLSPYLMWIALIPLKLVAALFAPAAVLAAWWRSAQIGSVKIGAIALGWITMAMAVLMFNYATMDAAVPPSYERASATSVSQLLKALVGGVPRTWLAFWYGSIASWPVFAAVTVVTMSGVCAYARLVVDARGGSLRALGGSLLGLSLLLAVAVNYGGWRLMGYGAIVLVLGFRPRERSGAAWLVYGLAALVLAIANAWTTNSMGVNDPRYAEVARTAVAAGVRPPVATNSFHVLDVHEGVGSHPVSGLGEVREDRFFLVKLPAYDAIATSVWTVVLPGTGWCVEAEFFGGALYGRCDGSRRAGSQDE
jgi:hypothetical protein